jgi:hypothetical protein
MNRREFSRAAAGLTAGVALPAVRATEAGAAGSITDVQGVKVGHFTESRRPTGCTVLLFEKGATAGVDVRGSAPGTRETDLLNPINTVQQVQAILLAGGSAFGLDAASGVVRYLDEHRLGYAVGDIVVPIVPAAILYDLELGDSKIRPTAESGYKACQAATSERVPEGNVGAGAGATIGKLFGMKQAMKSGLGSAGIRVGGTGIVVGAIVAVNAVGDVVDPRSGKIIAGARKPDGSGFVDSMARRIQRAGRCGHQYNHRRGCDERGARQNASHQGGANGARWAGADHLSGTHAQRWRYDLRGGNRVRCSARASRRHWRAGRGSDGTGSPAGRDERSRHRGAARL